MKHIVSFSGGKDSTLMLLLMLEKGMPIDEIIFADTGMEFQELYDYIEKIENFTGRKVTRIKSKKTWDELFFATKKKGNNIGQIYGFPMTMACDMTRQLKLNPIAKYYRSIEGEYTVYIGIARNEPERYERLKPNEKAPLYEWGIDENFVIQELKRRGLHNPLYDTFDRLGCYTCPNMNLKELRLMRKRYPKEYSKLLWYGEQAEKHATSQRFGEYKPGWTLSQLERRFQMEDLQGILWPQN
ncbi:MAG: phosphoadenosine phosphosulfate reductase family protein [Bacteroidales bacterium]|jgi:3'-phosphoadenosine 5'-phosphosulfate sulfotransferase (PAPS reductase)/FAD synthetase|nr:phosphoadenosine phosphosulfate reductase family protein [Bacteroidales bacterium]MDD4776615.1 phosphoadenosine phosphosulfate reductase family protein [Syntrophomonas sp.]